MSTEPKRRGVTIDAADVFLLAGLGAMLLAAVRTSPEAALFYCGAVSCWVGTRVNRRRRPGREG